MHRDLSDNLIHVRVHSFLLDFKMEKPYSCYCLLRKLSCNQRTWSVHETDPSWDFLEVCYFFHEPERPRKRDGEGSIPNQHLTLQSPTPAKPVPRALQPSGRPRGINWECSCVAQLLRASGFRCFPSGLSPHNPAQSTFMNGASLWRRLCHFLKKSKTLDVSFHLCPEVRACHCGT